MAIVHEAVCDHCGDRENCIVGGQPPEWWVRVDRVGGEALGLFCSERCVRLHFARIQADFDAISRVAVSKVRVGE